MDTEKGTCCLSAAPLEASAVSQPPRDYLSVVEAAARSGIKVATLRNMIFEGKLGYDEGLRRPKGSRRTLIYWPEFQKNFLDFRLRGRL